MNTLLAAASSDFPYTGEELLEPSKLLFAYTQRLKISLQPDERAGSHDRRLAYFCNDGIPAQRTKCPDSLGRKWQHLATKRGWHGKWGGLEIGYVTCYEVRPQRSVTAVTAVTQRGQTASSGLGMETSETETRAVTFFFLQSRVFNTIFASMRTLMPHDAASV